MKNDTVLLTRDQFRTSVFDRDKHACVVCHAPAQDAHHILERRLWPNSGYYINNGASVCGPCHLQSERTEISVEMLREKCGITKPIIPPHLYHDVVYDKWANIILDNGTRLKGELFYDPSVQKILGEGKINGISVLSMFINRVKYPRTHHLPWSPGITEDDRILTDLSVFTGRRVIVTEKMDGENTNMYSDGLHARSINGRNHPSRNWVKNFWSSIANDIPEDWRICGENLYALHSIGYDNLPSYFMGFSIWNNFNVCLSWDETQDWFKLLGITSVPVLYDGIWNASLIKSLYHEEKDRDTREGYVVRIADEFTYGDFRKSIAKYVRARHVAPDRHHWFAQAVVPNKLKIGS